MQHRANALDVLLLPQLLKGLQHPPNQRRVVVGVWGAALPVVEMQVIVQSEGVSAPLGEEWRLASRREAGRIVAATNLLEARRVPQREPELASVSSPCKRAIGRQISDLRLDLASRLRADPRDELKLTSRDVFNDIDELADDEVAEELEEDDGEDESLREA